MTQRNNKSAAEESCRSQSTLYDFERNGREAQSDNHRAENRFNDLAANGAAIAAAVEEYLLSEEQEYPRYFSAQELAEEIEDQSTRGIAAVLPVLSRESTRIDITCWSRSSGSQTWKMEDPW